MTLRFFDRLDKLDKLLERGPAAVRFADEILPLLEDELAGRYFLSKISDATWLPILNENGLFDTIPPKGTGIFPSDLLKRLASTAPTPVMEIIATLPDTENEWVHRDLLEAATIALEEAESEVVSWAGREARWIRAQEQLDVVVVNPATALTVALCGAGCEAAFAVAEALLDLSCMLEKRQGRSRVKPRIDEWHYRDVLKQLRAPLTVACGAKAIGLFMQLLIQATGESDLDPADNKIHVWRPAVEDAEQNAPNSLLNWLVVAVRDSTLQLVESDGVAALDVLETDRHKTFHRVALHIRRVAWDLDTEETVMVATSTPVLEDPLLRHELLLLIKEKFEEFPQRFRNRYFAFIRQLKEPDKRFRFLHSVAEYLAGELSEDYASLRAESDPQDLAEPFEVGTVSWGPTSPISMDEMKEVSVSELVERIKTWKPGTGSGHGSPEGLARQLGQYAEQEPATLSARASGFIGVDPTYVRGLANGLAKALKDNDTIERFSWADVLALCEKAVLEPWDKQQGSDSFDDFDKTWGPARLEIARLLEAGLRQGLTAIPADLLPTTWRTLGALLEDADPTEEEEASRLESSDPTTIAINTIRGTAMQGLMYYAFRKRQSVCESPPFPPMAEFAPEVMKKLELHLDRAKEPSLAVRSAYGKWLPQLYGLDKEWTVASLDNIFPRDAVRSTEAAWDAYLAFSQVHIDLLPTLRTLYERAVQGIGKHSEDLKALADPDERLGGHLILFYRHNALELDDPLLSGFFNAATDDVRYEVLSGAARGIQDLKDKALAAACQRLKLLWERRADETKGSGDATRERSAFCWWFIKEEFEPAWALGHLALALERGAELELEGRVLGRLKELVSEYTYEVFECLALMVRKTEEHRWGLYDDDVKEILRTILSSGDLLHGQAEDLVHYIGSLGFLSFRELLQVE